MVEGATPGPTTPLSGSRLVTFSAVMAAGLAAVAIVNLAPSVLSPFLVEEFSWDRWQVGALVGLFSLTGALGSPAMAMGRAADRIGGARTLRLVFAGSTAAILAIAASPGFVVMAAVMLVAGILAAAVNPATNILTGEDVDPAHQGTVVGIKQAGGPIGITLLGLVPLLATSTGWRWALVVTVTVPVAGLVALRLTVRHRTSPRHVAPAGRRHAPRRNVRLLALNGLLVGGGGGALVAFLPLYGEEIVGLSKASAGAAASLLGAVGIVARVAWGWQRSRFAHLATPLSTVGVLGMLSALLVWMASGGPVWLFGAGAATAGAGFMAWNTLAMLAMVEDIEDGQRGSAAGDVVFGFLIGWGVSPLLFGLLVDATGTYAWGWACVVALSALSVVVSERWRRSAA